MNLSIKLHNWSYIIISSIRDVSSVWQEWIRSLYIHQYVQRFITVIFACLLAWPIMLVRPTLSCQSIFQLLVLRAVSSLALCRCHCCSGVHRGCRFQLSDHLILLQPCLHFWRLKACELWQGRSVPSLGNPLHPVRYIICISENKLKDIKLLYFTTYSSPY